MREETKAALKEMIEAIKVSNALCNMVELSPNTPIHYYNNKELEALADAFEKEKQTKIKYHTLFLQERGWTQDQIDEWLKRAGL